ncbi:MAG: hypothetical protein AAGF85_10900 [Bacteroidota bacterium]
MQGFTETEFGFFKIEDSILIFIYKSQQLFDEAMAEKVIEDRFKFSHYQEYPVLADIRGVEYFSSNAKKVMVEKGNQLISAAAILVKSPVERMIANSYININKPPKPTRMFTDEKRAIKWLGKFVNKDK